MRSFLASASLLLLLAGVAQAASVTGSVTADNHYGLYSGDLSGTVMSFYGANEPGSGGAGGYNWTQPESYSFTTTDQYIYIAAWSDDSIAQGLLADFTIDGNKLLSGDPVWEVWDTGNDLDDGASPPSVVDMGTQIALANSAGWKQIVVGGVNGAGPWGAVAGIDSNAKWMWYDGAIAGDAFAPGADHGEYLIFRTSIVPEPASLGLLGAGLAVLMRRRGR